MAENESLKWIHSLNLFSSVLHGAAPIGDITQMAPDWRRRIRLQGGTWQGTFSITDQPLSICQDLFYTYLGAHLVETSGASNLEFIIWEMDLEDDPKNPRLDVTAAGYIRTAQNKFITAGDGSMDNVSSWIQEIIETDCQFLQVGNIKTNTLQVKKSVDMEMRGFDELLKKTQLGDASGKPWRIWCDVDREVHYEQISTTPEFFVHGGIRRRRSLELMANRVGGTYVDNSNAVHTLTAVQNDPSIQEYGYFEDRLALNDLPAAAAAARRDAYLAESAFPWARAIGSKGTMPVFDVNGREINPFTVRPGVFRDLAYPGGGTDTDQVFLTDIRDFLVDEIEVAAGGELNLRTWLFDEADLLQLQDNYFRDLQRQAEREKMEAAK